MNDDFGVMLEPDGNSFIKLEPLRDYHVLKFIRAGNLLKYIRDEVPRRKRSIVKNRKISQAVKFRFGSRPNTDEKNEMARHDRNEYAFEEGNDCSICKIHFKFNKHYEQHCKIEHNNSKPYSCQYCYRSTARKLSLIQHLQKKHSDEFCVVRRHKWKQKKNCEVCNVELPGSAAFEKHALTIHRGVKMMECPECDAAFFRRSALHAHQTAKHARARVRASTSLRCNICRNVFPRSDVYENHKLRCMERWKKERMDDSKINLRKLGKEGTRTCHKCGVLFKNIVSLKKHLKIIHEENKARPYHCNICQKSFTSAISIEMHHSKHHIQQADKPCVRKFRMRQQYRCLVCGDDFFGVVQYENHGRTVHPGKHTFECDICSQGFYYKATMKRHIQSRHAEPNFSCVHCEKSFAMLGERNRHEKTCPCINQVQLNKEEFFCDICRKNLRGSAKYHIRVHKDYDHCEFCDKRFSRKTNPKGLYNHVILRHPDHSLKVNALERAAHILQCEEEER